MKFQNIMLEHDKTRLPMRTGRFFRLAICILAFGLTAFAALVGLASNSTTNQSANKVTASGENQPDRTAEFTLEESCYFMATDESLVAVEPGQYKVDSIEKDVLRLTSDTEDPSEIRIRAVALEHEETIDAPSAFAIVVDETEHHLVLLMPDGRGFEAAGFNSPILPRGLNSMRRVKRDTIRTQVRFGRATIVQRPAQTRPAIPSFTKPAVVVRPESTGRLGTQGSRPSTSVLRYRFEVLSPGDGAVWRTDFSYPIQWKLTYVSGVQRDLTANRQTDIDLMTAAGQKVLDVFEGIASGTFAWTVPKQLAPGAYRLRITLPGRTRHSEVFRIDNRVPLVVRLASQMDVNEVWSIHEENGHVVRILQTRDLVPYAPPIETPQGIRESEYDARIVIYLSPEYIYTLQFIQQAPIGVGVLLPEPCDTEIFRPGKQRHPGYTLLRETITLYDPPDSFYFERRGRMEQILRGPDGRLYLFVVFTPSGRSSNESWFVQAQQTPVLLETAIASGYRPYSLAEFNGKQTPFSGTEE